jgi:hypothetical protein
MIQKKHSILTTNCFYSRINRTAVTDEPKTEKVRSVSFCVPVDDTHQIGASIRWVPKGEIEEKTGREKLAPGGIPDRTYEFTQRHPDDKEAQEGQGPIAIHPLEHLVSSDKGVIMFRKILREAINATKEGRDPKGIIREPNKSKCVSTTGGSIVRDL